MKSKRERERELRISIALPLRYPQGPVIRDNIGRGQIAALLFVRREGNSQSNGIDKEE